MSTALTRLQDEHKQRLQTTKAKTIQSIFEHAAAVLAFYEDCKKTREWGESTFANRIGEWLDYSQPTAGHWLMLARGKNKFITLRNKIPVSYRSLAELSVLPQEDIEECLEIKGADTTYADVIAFKRALKAPPVKPAYVEPKPTKQELETKSTPPIDTKEVEAEWKAAENSVEHLAEVKNFQIDKKPESVLGLLIIELLAIGDEPTVKAVKQVLAKAYHPDTGRIRKDAALMSDINRCFDSIRRIHSE